MSWLDQAERVAEGKWIKFTAANPVREMIITGVPKRIQKESTIKGKEGETYYQMSFPVLVDGEDRILEPNKSLLAHIVAEEKDLMDQGLSIIGSEIMIQVLDPPTNKQWRIRVLNKGIQADTWTGKKEARKQPKKGKIQETEEKTETNTEEEEEPAPIPEAEEQDDKRKKKFKKEVAKRTKARKEVEKNAEAVEPADKGSEIDQDGNEEEESPVSEKRDAVLVGMP